MQLNYEEFKQAVTRQIKDFLPESYADSEVSLNCVLKNNEKLDAVIIKSPTSNMAPTIYLGGFFNAYRNGETLDAVLGRMADIYVQNDTKGNFEIKAIMDYENVKDRIVPRLVGLDNNAEYLAGRPYTEVDGLAAIYTIQLGEDEAGSMSVTITNDMMKSYGVDINVLHDVAVSNMSTLTPYEFMGMKEVIVQMMGEDFPMEEIPEDDMMFILTNRQRMNGAALLLDRDVMDRIAQQIGQDFFIIPSSIHEVILVPQNGDMEYKDLEKMVCEVNSTQVEPQDKLSDHIYRYDYEVHELYRADRLHEHELKKESLIINDIKAAGFRPEKRIVDAIKTISRDYGELVSLKKISEMAKLPATEIEHIDNAVKDVVEACRQQELSRLQEPPLP